MTPQERAGMAAAINEAIAEGVARGCAAVRAQCAAEVEAVRRACVPVADLPAVVAEAVAQAEQRLAASMTAQVARAAMRLGDAPAWSRTALYLPGAIVSHYSGRTYELREGVAGSMSQEPGEHADVWARIGSHGLRVMKSKPEAPQPGDLYAEDESRFITDGETTTLLVPAYVKKGDLDRACKPIAAQAAAAFERASNAERIARKGVA